jgi:hypothetical protein
MRISVSLVVNLVANGMNRQEILEAYPDLEDEDITQALKYAAWTAGDLVTEAAQHVHALPGRHGNLTQHCVYSSPYIRCKLSCPPALQPAQVQHRYGIDAQSMEDGQQKNIV